MTAIRGVAATVGGAVEGVDSRWSWSVSIMIKGEKTMMDE
jgi:hypothetical protein